MLSPPPLSLYIHVPWCVKKCPYCDFNSHAQKDALPEDAYITALIDDLKADQRYAQGRKISSIFIGGGTPSLFCGQSYQRLLKPFMPSFRLPLMLKSPWKRIPVHLSTLALKIIAKRVLIVCRLGCKVFKPNSFKRWAEFIHQEEATQAIMRAKQAGFHAINIDLMHGLPGQTLATAMDDLDQAIALAPEHISWYQLTIEPNTLFHSRPPVLPQDEVLSDIEQAGRQKASRCRLCAVRNIGV